MGISYATEISGDVTFFWTFFYGTIIFVIIDNRTASGNACEACEAGIARCRAMQTFI